MTPLGNITRKGCTTVARAVLREAHEHGQVAVFVGHNGEAAAVAHYESGFRNTVESRFPNLVGVYRFDEGIAEDDFFKAAPLVAFDIFATYEDLPHERTIRRPVAPPRQPRRGAGAVSGGTGADQDSAEVCKARALGAPVHSAGPRGGSRARERLLAVRERAQKVDAAETDVWIYEQVARGDS